MIRFLAVALILAGCRRTTADRTSLPADGESLAHVTFSGGEPRIREGARHLRIESVDGHRMTLRAGVLPGKVVLGEITFDITPFFADREGDGTPDALRLSSDSDRDAFRRWFTFLSEAQYFRSPLPRDIVDCAALIRYAYREALREHDDAWTNALALRFVPSIPGVRKYQYPYTPLGANLFRVRAGPFAPADIGDGAFAQFADAQTLLRFNVHFVTKDIRAALPGDMLFFHQSEQRMPFHTMIYLGASQVDRTAGPYLLYHTGPDGEVRRVTVGELDRHPEARWHPVPTNENFLGVYRWNIL